MALLVLAQNVAVQRGFLDPPAAADLNGRNLSALYEIVDSRERNPQVLGRLFYGKQIVNRSFAQALGERLTVNHSDHFINYENWHKARGEDDLLERGEAGQRGQLAAEPLREAECLEGPVGWARESAGEQPNPTSAILDEKALGDVIGAEVFVRMSR